MASTVAKFPVYNINNEDFMRTRNISKTMEEDVVLDQLCDDSYAQRAEILEYLNTEVRKHGGKLPFESMPSLFRGLSRALADSNWTVRHMCVQLISEMIAGLEEDLDNCMSIVLPKLVSNLGDSKVALRKAVIQTLHLYMKHSQDVQHVFHAIVEHGLENPDPKVRAETTINFPLLLTPEFARQDLYSVTQALAKRLHGNTDSEEGKIAIISLERIRSLVGDAVFESYIQRLSKAVRLTYLQLTDREENGYDVNLNSSKGVFGSGSWKSVHNDPKINIEDLEFGIIPKRVMDQLLDQNDLRVRAQGVEELRNIMNSMFDTSRLLPHLLGYISFLCNLLDDVNFKVSTVTLEIFGILVNKLGQGVKPYLKSLMTALTKRLGDNQIVIRQANMKVLMNLMHILTPKPVLSLLGDCLQHRNSRVREEALNVVIASLLTFPSYDFDLGQLCQTIAHTLVDPKRKVRQASLEAFAVLAQAMGAGRLAPLVTAVDSVELSMEGDGVMAAVQARLARRQLPRLNKDGLVEYAIPLPSSATHRGAPPGADAEWVMAASGGGTASARERSHNDQHYNRELSQPLSARATSGGVSQEQTGPTPAPRRYHSAGKNRKKLPWEELPNEDNRESNNSENTNKTHPNSAPIQKRQSHDKPPLKARNTWNDLEDNNDITKSHRLIKGSGGSRDHSPDSGPGAGGSYHLIYLNKLKKERERASLSNTHPGATVPTTDSSGSHSAPVTDRDLTPWKLTNGAAFNKYFGGPEVLPNSKKRTSRQDEDSRYFPSFGSSKEDEYTSQRMSLASSWPDPAKDTSPKARKRVGPLSEPTTPSTTQPPEWPDDDSKRSGKVQSSSIPLKPTLARSASKKTKHVPPLQLNEKGSAAKSNFSDAESERSGAYVISSSRGTNSDWDDEEDDIDRDQMKNSLMSLRNSAARKRAARRADSMTSSNTTSRSPSPHSMDESGIYSILYDTGSLEDSPKNTPKKKGKKNPDSPFSNRPRVARVSTSDREVSDTSRDSSRDTFRDSSRDSSRDTDTTRELEPNPFEFSPTGGVTFRDKVQSDVSVVGMGYGKNDVFRTDSPPIPTHQKGNARRKQNKGLLVSPLTMASLNHPGAVDTDDFTDEVGVIGKGVFGTSYAPPSHEYSGDRSKRGKERKDSESGRNGLPPGVYGIGVKQNSTEDNESSDDEEPSSISMSKSTKDKMARIQQEKKEELEQRKAEKQAEKEKQQRDREKWQKQQEKERIKAREQKEKIKKMDSTSEEIGLDTLTISGSGSNTLNTSTTKSKVITGKPPVATTPKKKSYKSPSSDASMETTSTPKNSSKSKLNRSSSQHDPDDDGEELKPFTNPESSLRDCLRFMNQDDWEVKLDGIRYVRRLTIFHPDVLNLQLHTVIVALLKEIKNLRSSVSRAAICTVADMFTHLRSSLDKDMDQLCKVLLHKAGESNGFIREDVDKSLAAMVESVTPQRALVALVAGGASHRSIAVRKTCAQFLVGVVERMGPGRLLSGIKDITDKIVPTAAQFCVDGSPETRYYGRKIMYKLMNHEDFEKLLAKYVPHKDLRQVREILEKLRVDGLGEMPSETPSARARRTYPSSGSGMRTNSGSREKINSAGSNADPNGLTPPSSTRKIRRSPRMDEASMATVQNLCSGLSASDWRDRYKAVQDFLDMTAHNVDLVVSNIIKIFDSYTPRLSDSNSKVNLTALTAMLQIVPRLREYIGAVINSVVPVLATNLASKNAQIHQTTLSVLDSLVEHVENSLLLQPFANVAQYGNARIKPCMIDKLAYLSTKVYPRKQQTVVRQVLPVLWHLLSNTSGSGAVPGGTGNIRTATTNLANTLFALMGQSLLDQAQSVLTPRNYKTLQDMLENQ